MSRCDPDSPVPPSSKVVAGSSPRPSTRQRDELWRGWRLRSPTRKPLQTPSSR
jgi:hypothetical protein